MKKWRVIVIIDGRWMETVLMADCQSEAWQLARAVYGKNAVQNVIEIR